MKTFAKLKALYNAIKSTRIKLHQLFGSLFGSNNITVKYGEFQLFNPFKPVDSLKNLWDIVRFSEKLPPVIMRHPYVGADKIGEGETWLFVNGIMTNDASAKLNIEKLQDLFKRDITHIYNKSENLLSDLYECVIGKVYLTDCDYGIPESMTPEAYSVAGKILSLLSTTNDKVVVLAHSQGTIITKNAMVAVYNHLLNTHGEDAMNKMMSRLEIYTFANCAEYRTRSFTLGNIEHFVNYGDVVPMLVQDVENRGTEKEKVTYRFDGDVNVRYSNGHLLNQHYLDGLRGQKYGKTSALYDYLA